MLSYFEILPIFPTDAEMSPNWVVNQLIILEKKYLGCTCIRKKNFVWNCVHAKNKLVVGQLIDILHGATMTRLHVNSFEYLRTCMTYETLALGKENIRQLDLKPFLSSFSTHLHEIFDP